MYSQKLYSLDSLNTCLVDSNEVNGEKNHCSYNVCNYTMEIALCNVTVFGSESVLLLPGVTAALWETVDRPALALLCGDALDRQIPASVNANGLNTSVWSYFHYVFFHQQSFAPELYFSHIHSLLPYSSV